MSLLFNSGVMRGVLGSKIPLLHRLVKDRMRYRKVPQTGF